MKPIEEFLSDLNSLDIKLWVEGDLLRYNAPKGSMTSTILSQIKECKTEIVQKLSQDSLVECIRPVKRDNPLPLSFAQQRLWLTEQLQPNSCDYNEPVALHLAGFLNIAALEKSVNEIIRRHEILRTTFQVTEGQPVQVIAANYELRVSIINLKELPKTKSEEEACLLARQEAQLPFDLTRLPLIRVTVLQISDRQNVLLITVHHIVWDGWSIGVLIQELNTLYQAFCAGKPALLPELPIQYADFAVWQRKWLQGETLEDKLAYWLKSLGNNLPTMQLPTVCPRTQVTTNRGNSLSSVIPCNLADKIQTLSYQENVSLFMTLLAAFQVLLLRYTNQDDLVIGTDIANRNLCETQALIGFFTNLLVLRTSLRGNPSFRKLLKRVSQITLEAYEHQDLPFELLVKALQPKRNSSNIPPLCQVLFVFQNTPMPSLNLTGLTLEKRVWRNDTARFDLAVFLTRTSEGIVQNWRYNSDLFTSSTISVMASHFENLLSSIVRQPDARINTFKMLSDQEIEERNKKKRIKKISKLTKFKAITTRNK